MHLLAAKPGTVTDGSEAVDLGQTPGDIVVLSAADTELANLATARAERGAAFATVRLANFTQLSHNLSVDLYVDGVVAGARLVIVRLLGGIGYWPYGIERIAETCRRHGIKLAVVPGDDQPDPALPRLCSLPDDACHRLWQYCVHGGAANASEFLNYAASLIGAPVAWREPVALLRAGPYWPGMAQPSLDDVQAHWTAGAPVAAIVFYRALVQAGNTGAVDALIAGLAGQGLNPLPVYVHSLKEEMSAETVRALFAAARPSVILNATAFAVSNPGAARRETPYDDAGCPVLQVVFAGNSEEAWRAAPTGLSARDIAMNVALPEVDGRILARAVSFKTEARFDAATETSIVAYRPVPDRIAFTARLAAAWARLNRTPPADRKIAILLANYPNKNGRIANGVGLDTPAGTVNVLRALADAGYGVEGIPETGNALIERLLAGPTNAPGGGREAGVALPVAEYEHHFAALPDAVRRQVTERWGDPKSDPFVRGGAFRLALRTFGNVVVGIQPARGYNIDPVQSYHDPALVPPHGYLAFYIWLREAFGAHSVVHMGKHGNLEWLPGKSVALTEDCFPEAVFGPLPHVYPFIVNDPGEGTQAKRRAAAVIIDHLTPPLTRAENYGPLAELERLVDEYYEAAGVDPRRLAVLKKNILELTQRAGLDKDCGIAAGEAEDAALAKLDNYLCELKELQIRDGLHIFGEAPADGLLTDLLVALVRLPRGKGEGADASLLRALARDLGIDRLDEDKNPLPPPRGRAREGGKRVSASKESSLGRLTSADPPPSLPLKGGGVFGDAVGEAEPFDPLDCVMGAPWSGARPDALAAVSADPWRTNGDTVERLEILAQALVCGDRAQEPDWPATRAVLDGIEATLRPAVTACGPAEIAGLLTALDGRFVAPGASGAPTRGRPDVLPTGRNFYSVDTRTVPTPAAWLLGWKSASLLLDRHRQEHGAWPKQLAVSAWGTSNMRTGGDDIAQTLALMGVRPTWDAASGRVVGFEILPLDILDRPRVDVTFRLSGFFRDAFPAQIDLIDSAVQAVAALDEDAKMNPLAARVRDEAAALRAGGMAEDAARRRASFRIFGSKPGAYGAGLQALIDERGWDTDADLARAYIAWGGYAYGAGTAGAAEHKLFERRLGAVEGVVQNQDNREHDLLDSDDYYQFEGGMAAAVRHLSGAQPALYHNDHSRPETPRIRTLAHEIGRVVRARVVNPKWIAGVMRHGYKGAFEMAATVDYLFAFAATARVVEDHHFDLVYEAYLQDSDVRAFLEANNPDALKEMAERLAEAQERGLWRPRSNRAYHDLKRIAGEPVKREA